MNPNKGEEDPASDKDSRLDLSITQVLAAAGAATLGAVLATLFGVYGTIIGTAVLSLVTSVGSVLLVHFTQKTTEKIKAPLARNVPGIMKAEGSKTKTAQLDPNWDTNAAAYRSTQVNLHHDPDSTQPLSAIPDSATATGTATVVGLADRPSNVDDPMSNTLVDMEPVRDSEESTPSRFANRKKLWISIAVSTVLVFVITIGALSLMAWAQDKDPSYYFGPSPVPTPEMVDPTPDEEPDHQQPPPADDNQEDGGDDQEPAEEESPERSTPEEEETEDPDEDPNDSEGEDDEEEDEDGEEDEGNEPTSSPGRS